MYQPLNVTDDISMQSVDSVVDERDDQTTITEF